MIVSWHLCRTKLARYFVLWFQTLGKGKWGRKKCRRIPKCEGDWQGRVPKCSLPRKKKKLFKTRDLELPIFEGSVPSCSPHSAGYTRTSVHPYFPVTKNPEDVFSTNSSGTDMTGRPGYRTMAMIGGSSAPYLARTPCVPLFVLRLIGLETKNVLDYQGRAGDHFHCTVERSPSHIRCRIH